MRRQDDRFLGEVSAFDVRGEETVTLRADSLIGWIGLLSPDPTSASPGGSSRDELVTFSGEGAVLFRVPQDS